MTTPINVDEARVALKTWSLRIPKAQMALLNAALDRLEELQKNGATIERISAVMGCVPEGGDDLVEAVKLLVQERDEAIRQERLADGHAKRMTESVVCVEAERDDLKARLETALLSNKEGGE